jgi:hypothetical protein
LGFYARPLLKIFKYQNIKIMSFIIRRATEALLAKLLFFVFFGEPGTGKTSLSFTMPKPLHFDFDDGIHRAVQKIRPDSIKVTNWIEFYNFIMSVDFANMVKENGYKSVVLDTIGTMIDNHIISYLLTQPQHRTAIGLKINSWVVVSDMVKSLKARFTSLDLHICAICHGKEYMEGDTKKWGLDVKGSSRSILYSTCDMLGFMYANGNQVELDFNPNSRHVGKNMANYGILPVPQAETIHYDTYLTKLIEDCNKKITSKSAAQVQYNKELEEWKGWIDDADSIEAFTALQPQLAELGHQVLKATLGAYFMGRLKKKGFQVDKKTKEIKAKEPKAVVNEN